MRLARIIASACLLSSSPSFAAEWWLMGHSGKAPDRIVTYVDRQTATRVRGDEIEMWVLNIAEKPTGIGMRAQMMKYHYRCGKRSLAMVERVAYDADGKVMPLASPAPEPFQPAVAGSIGETALNFICGRPAGIELKVDDAIDHALKMFAADAQQVAVQSPPREEEKARGLSLGTGFFVGPAGNVFTSYHVIDGAERIGCRTSDGKIHAASLERGSRANDLALLKVNVRPAAYLSFAPPASMRPGDRVFTIGFGAPNYLGVNEPRFTDGTISALSGLGAEDAYMQISVPVQPGNSGGPLVNEAGQVVGVIAAQAAVEEFVKIEGAFPQNINWAVKSDYASPLLAGTGSWTKRARDEAIRTARESLCLIMAE